MNTVYIGADHRGFRQKEEIKANLRQKGYHVIDLGAASYDKDDDYTDIAFELGSAVVKEKAKGIMICGSGVGVCIAVNKVKGVRAGLCLKEKQVVAARNDDDINVLCLSGDILSVEENENLAELFLNTIFGSEERYIRRIQKINSYEKR